MSDLHIIDSEIHNFGPLYDPDENGTIRVVYTERGDEIRWVLCQAGVR